MDERMKELVEICKERFRGNQYRDLVDEIIELLLKDKCDENDKLNLLGELFRFSFYSHVVISLDPRGDHQFKFSALYNIKKNFDKNEFSKEDIKNLKNANNHMRDFVDNPLDFVDKKIEFYKEYPDIIF